LRAHMNESRHTDINQSLDAHIHIRTYTHVHIDIRIHTYTRIHTHMHTHAHIHTYMHTYTHTYIHACQATKTAEALELAQIAGMRTCICKHANV